MRAGDCLGAATLRADEARRVFELMAATLHKILADGTDSERAVKTAIKK